MAASSDDWKTRMGALGGLLRLDWLAAARTGRRVLAGTHARPVDALVLPKGVTTTAGPGARLDWLVSRPIRSAIGGRVVELYFRQLFAESGVLYPTLDLSRFRFDATRDVLRWTPTAEVRVSPSTCAAIARLYDGLFTGNDTVVREMLVTLGLAREATPADTGLTVAAMRRHMAGVSLRAVDFRAVSLLSTFWRLSSAVGKHGSKVHPDLFAVALMLASMNRTLRQLRASVDVGGAYQRAKNG